MAGIVAVEANEPEPGARTPRRRQATKEAIPDGIARFFLAKAGGTGAAPALDREFQTEGEAMIESLKTGQSYFSIVEWRATADFAGKNPQVKKEAVKKKG